MTDTLSAEQRSALMARIRGRDTKPELTVRRLLHALGYRFRIQARGLPGRPDVALTRRRKAVFVHGCFWHQHEGCRAAQVPKTRVDFWTEKFARNRRRDAAALEALEALGWSALVVWECELRRPQDLALRLQGFLGPTAIGRRGG